MSVSAARKKLNAPIEAATDPTVLAQLTTALGRLIDAEGRARERRQRQEARVEEAREKQKPAVNLDDEIIF